MNRALPTLNTAEVVETTGAILDRVVRGICEIAMMDDLKLAAIVLLVIDGMEHRLRGLGLDDGRIMNAREEAMGTALDAYTAMYLVHARERAANQGEELNESTVAARASDEWENALAAAPEAS